MSRAILWMMAVNISTLGLSMGAVRASTPEQEKQLINRFIASLQDSDGIPEDRRERLIQSIQSLRDDDRSRSLAITEGLRQMYPRFRAALDAMGGEDFSPASAVLLELAKSDDAFLSAEASFYLAQAYTFSERFEDAIPLLENLLRNKAETTVQTGDALFLLGVSQARMLERNEAIQTFTRFLEDYPHAPERMRVGAWRQCEQLKVLEEGTLADVYDRMDYSRRRLQLGEAGQPTQQQQQTIIAMLAKLIKEAEECECQGTGQQPGEGQRDQQGKGQGAKGGNSENENGVVRRTYRGGPDSPWSKLRDRQRDPAFSAIKEKFPARYQQLIEQYYKSFQEDRN